jgi:pimeloyl-ACP methyl ester carboxylesterase
MSAVRAQPSATSAEARMSKPILVLHGWSDDYESFQPLRKMLAAAGYAAVPILLGNYRSMEDHTTFDNLAEGLQARIQELIAVGQLPTQRVTVASADGSERTVEVLAPFSLDVIAHSTGGPVVRHWLTRYLKNVAGGLAATMCPIHRMILLAPANFGSRLAAQGQSALAMIFRGGVKHDFQTGRAILQGLELGSPFLCSLADRDLFAERLYPVERDKGPYVFVFSGTKTYSQLKGLVAPGATEDGSDGTIRAASAAMSSIRIRADFTDVQPGITFGWQRNEPIAFRLVEDRNHSEIVPRDGAGQPVFALIRRCLAVNDWAAYQAVRAAFDAANEEFYAAQRATADGVRAYQQFVVRVLDDMDVEVDDYQLSFHVVADDKTTSTWSEQTPTGQLAAYQEYTTTLQRDVIVHVQAHSVRPAYRTFFVDLDGLKALQAKLDLLPGKPFIAMNIEAMSPTPGVVFDTDRLHYLPLNGSFADPNGRATTFFAPNTTTLVDIRLKPLPGTSIFEFK